MADRASRLYELRLPRLADARVRDAVVAALARWAPERAGPSQGEALGRTGVVLRLPLGDAEAAALLRDLYATGVAPAGVVLRPLGPGMARDPADTNSSFAVFARQGGRFVPTWNWKAFVFGPLWYLRRGLYAKGLVLLALSVCPFFTLILTVLLSSAVLVYCGVAGNWDDYLWKVKGTQWW
jgi:Protein of unknown function (DUF2628)